MILAGIIVQPALLFHTSYGVYLSSVAIALMVIVLVTAVTAIFIARRWKNKGNHSNALSKIVTYVFSTR